MSGQTPDCLFCQVARAEVPAEVVYSDLDSVAFLDHRPVFKGHVLLVPRMHYPTLADVPKEALSPLMIAAQRIALAVEQGLDAQGTFVAMNNRISQSVPHLHVHIVPRRKGDGLRGFFWPRTKYASAEELKEFADRIVKALRTAND